MANSHLCPKCGSTMVRRKARVGKNAGGFFYGCSKYPQCRGTLPADDIVLDRTNGKADHRTPDEFAIDFPRSLFARPRFNGYQTRFHECVAVTSSMMEIISESDSSSATLKEFAQWRLDFPISNGRYQLDDRGRNVLSVVEKILTRGRITMMSADLEEKFKKLYKVTTEKWKAPDPSPWQQPFDGFDSTEEQIFYENVLPKLIPAGSHVSVIPQVEIKSLLPIGVAIEASASRVDFAIFFSDTSECTVIEIDGAQHEQHIEADRLRDTTLLEHGITVIRIPTEEIRTGDGPNILKLSNSFAPIGENDSDKSGNFAELIKVGKIAHQLQLSLLQAMQSGLLNLEDYSNWDIQSDVAKAPNMNAKIGAKVLAESVSDFTELVDRVKRLYGLDLVDGDPNVALLKKDASASEKDQIRILLHDYLPSDIPTFYVQNIYVPFHIASSSFPVSISNQIDLKHTEQDLEYFLQYFFRKDSFWEGQYDSVSRTHSGEDSLILLPTGAGKSIIYQLASLLLPGRTIVIDPIISLIADQMDNLALYGIDRCVGITSQIIEAEDRSKAMQLFGQGEYLFAFVAPERFQTSQFRESLRTLTVHTPIAAIVIDEAHCVSEWGHDFRTAYLNIGRTSREYCESSSVIPPVLALTGTASRAVLKDVQRELQIEDFDSIVTPRTFDRPELKFRIISARSSEKGSRLKGYLGQALPGLFNVTSSTFFQPRGGETYAGIIFCPWVNGEFGVTQIADEISHELGIGASHYSGKAPKGWDSRKHRSYKRTTEKKFKRNEVPLLVSTKAFGMGIDKSNIRYTIHFGIPPSIESFYQEAGRAGRDRQVAQCCIIVSNDDDERSRLLLNPSTSVEQIAEIIERLDWDQNDDVTRDLFFHSNSFKGVEEEKRIVDEVVKHLGNLNQARKVNISIRKISRSVVEKALHRLLLIGIVSDYTIDYSASEFGVQLAGASKEDILSAYGSYIAGYLESRRQTEVNKATENLSLGYDQFISATIELLLRFIYDVIEKGRRRALLEMLLACTSSANDNDIRNRILRYLEATEYSEKLEDLLADEGAGFKQCKDIFSAVRSPNEAAEIRGQVSRYLESYPDHPGLLMLRFLSELHSRDTDIEVSHQNFQASIGSAKTNYSIEAGTVWSQTNSVHLI
jgi:ATP-dependent DNA helicase RecQ